MRHRKIRYCRIEGCTTQISRGPKTRIDRLSASGLCRKHLQQQDSLMLVINAIRKLTANTKPGSICDSFGLSK